MRRAYVPALLGRTQAPRSVASASPASTTPSPAMPPRRRGSSAAAAPPTAPRAPSTRRSARSPSCLGSGGSHRTRASCRRARSEPSVGSRSPLVVAAASPAAMERATALPGIVAHYARCARRRTRTLTRPPRGARRALRLRLRWVYRPRWERRCLSWLGWRRSSSAPRRAFCAAASTCCAGRGASFRTSSSCPACAPRGALEPACTGPCADDRCARVLPRCHCAGSS